MYKEQVARDDAIVSFAQDGVAVIRNIVDYERLSTVSADLTTLLADASLESSSEMMLLNGEVDSFSALALESSIPGHAADFLDASSIRYLYGRVPQQQSGPLLWRQDQPFSFVKQPSITAWMAVDAIGKSNSPEFWAGSHLGAWHVRNGEIDTDVVPESQSVLKMPDFEGRESDFDIRRWALEPGDVLFVNSLLVYSLPPLFGSSDVKVVGLNYVDARASLVRNVWVNSELQAPVSGRATQVLSDLVGLGSQSEQTGSLQSDQFPVAWPQEVL